MDWVRLFEDHHIEFVTRGPNTKRGEVSVKCPWCGEDDPSQHLGISLKTERWGCLRDATHRGHTPPRLIAGLLGCSTAHAKQIERQYSTADPETLEQVIAGLIEEPMTTPPKPERLILPGEFKAIKRIGPTNRFWAYLESRGFDDVDGLCHRYRLYCATTGRFKDRVILPIYDNAKLVGWTGRAISDPQNAPRYLTHGDIKSTIFNEDELEWGGETLFVTEGPFDALKLDFYGAPATCLFGVTPTHEQLAKLARLAIHWDRVVILFDDDAVGPSFYTSDWLDARNTIIGRLPDGVKDPGAMNRQQIAEIASSYSQVDTLSD